MSVSIQTPAGLKTAQSIYIQTAAGLKTVQAGYIGTPAGAKQFFSSGGGGGGGPKFTPSISGPTTASIVAGANTTVTFTSSYTGAPTLPLSYVWRLSGSGAASATITSGQGTNSINVTISGGYAGSTAITAQLIATDAASVGEDTGTLGTGATINVTVTAASGGGGGGGSPPKFTPSVSGPTSAHVAVGGTTNLTYSVAISGSPTTPVTYAWYVGGSGAITPSIIAGQGSSSITVQLTGNSATTGEGMSINCRVTDAVNVVGDTGASSTGVYLAASAS